MSEELSILLGSIILKPLGLHPAESRADLSMEEDSSLWSSTFPLLNPKPYNLKWPSNLNPKPENPKP